MSKWRLFVLNHFPTLYEAWRHYRKHLPEWCPEWLRRWYHLRRCTCCECQCEWDHVGCGYCLAPQADAPEEGSR